MLRDLPVVGRDVERHLVLDDDLADVLNAGAAGGRGGQVDQLVHLQRDQISACLVDPAVHGCKVIPDVRSIFSGSEWMLYK